MAQELSRLTLRSFEPKDEALVLDLAGQAFRGIEYVPRVRKGLSSPYFRPAGCFIAEEEGSAKGCVAVLSLPREGWFETRYLAVRPGPDQVSIAQKLVSRALQYTKENQASRVKAFVPSVQFYVDTYKNAGFKPVRRQVRVGWDLAQLSETGKSSVQTGKIPESMADAAARVWVNGLLPFWDWWVEEQGGPEAAGAWIKDSVQKGDNWIGAFVAGKLVGTTLVWPDFYQPGEARFNGVYVLPEFRDKGIGLALMNVAIKRAQELGQRKMNVYTVAFLDCLAPGAVLYLKSGGRIEAEYLQLEKL